MKKLAISTIKIYKLLISPALLVVFGGGCRFNPTCSEYAVRSIENYGAYKGIKMSFIRLLKCNPYVR